ncbi:MAG TPA: ABC transporter ATP-binding protein/permease [Beijerinckiaceae bacterium]|jgi:putative ATP-binding cassette transporter|nr:ABC transporter ATP-binding protein/permease [Beijerinckiaceae bacterium]
MSTLASQFIRLTRLCIAGEGGRIGLFYVFILFALGLGGIWITVQIIGWTAVFYNALQKLDVDTAVWQIGVFFCLIGASAAMFLTATYLRKMLIIRWRRTLTEAVLDRWLTGKAYWHLRDRKDGGIDNPDQRIAEDCRIYVDKLTGEAVELMVNIVAIVWYVSIVWGLSTFPLSFSLFGLSIEIPRYMVWAAPIYVVIASTATHLLGAPLKNINFEQQRREGDFRFALSRFREHVEAVALANGEEAERRLLRDRFRAVLDNWRLLARRDLILGCFTRPYMQTVLRIPLFLALPAFLAGKITFGGLMQISSAFSNVVTTLSWFIFSYRDLAELAAAANRLAFFLDAAENAGRQIAQPQIATASDSRLTIDDVRLSTPSGKMLPPFERLDLQAGTSYWLSGPSGRGKSTLTKAIAGLWPHAQGRIDKPEADIAFMPQQAYLPLGSLHAALAYPLDPHEITEERFLEALKLVGLERLSGLEGTAWEETRRGLSGGERQRLALARLILQQPDWAFLDEATSALDQESETTLLQNLRMTLPHTTFIFIAHRPPQGAGRFEKIDL